MMCGIVEVELTWKHMGESRAHSKVVVDEKDE